MLSTKYRLRDQHSRTLSIQFELLLGKAGSHTMVVNRARRSYWIGYRSKASRPGGGGRWKTPQKRKRAPENHDKESPSVRRQRKRRGLGDKNAGDKKEAEKETEQEGPAELTANLWKEELEKADPELELVKKSETMNLTESWWKYHLIRSALSHIVGKTSESSDKKTGARDENSRKGHRKKYKEAL